MRPTILVLGSIVAQVCAGRLRVAMWNLRDAVIR